MRLPLLLLALGACASDPGTSPGTLTKASDLVYQCDDSSGSFSCGTQIQLANGQLTATALHRDGTTGATQATGALTAAAQDQIDGLIAKLPLDTPDTIHDVGCGGAPLRSTTFSIQFTDGTAKDYSFEYGSGVASQIDDFVLQLVRQVNACGGDSVTLDACTPNAAPQL
jgi:hypothetical protein